MADEPFVFALRSAGALGERIARGLGVAPRPLEERDFEDGEHKSRPLVGVRGRDVYVVMALYGGGGQSVDDRLIRALLFAGALRDAGAGRITAVAPYLCYARKDRRTKPRDPVTTRHVARLFEAVGVDRIVTIDVHNLAAYQNAFRIGTEHLEARGLFVERCRAWPDPVTVVSPDPGGYHRAEALRDALAEVRPAPIGLAVMGKHRSEGVVSGELLVGPIEGRIAIIVDDLIATGTTLVRCAEACRRRGALEVHALATHAVFSAGAGATLAAPALDTVTVTDTVSGRSAEIDALDKVTVLDVAPMLAGAIDALHRDGALADV